MANNMDEVLQEDGNAYKTARENVYKKGGESVFVNSGYHHRPGFKNSEKRDRMNERKNVETVKNAGKAVHASKYDKLNHMTIDQLAAARAVLQKKMVEQKITRDKNRVLFEKFNSLNNEYVRTQQQIDKYYVTLSNNPLTRTLIQGKRHMLTIAYIKGGKLKPKGGKEGYGLFDELKRYRPLESMAVAGALTAGLAGIGFIPGVDFASFKKTLIDFFFNNKTNPVAAKVLFAGLAVCAGALAAKGVSSAVKRYKRNKANVNNMNYEMDKASLDEREKAEEAQRKKEEEAHQTFMNNMDNADKLYSAYKNDPAMVKKLTEWVLTNSDDFKALSSSQKLAVAKAVQKWVADEKEANKEVDEANKDDQTREAEARAAEQQKVLDDFKTVLRGDSAEEITNYIKNHAEQTTQLVDMLKEEIKNNPINKAAREALKGYEKEVEDLGKTEEEKLAEERERLHAATMKEFDTLLLGDSSDAIIDFIRKNPDYNKELVDKLEAAAAKQNVNGVAKEALSKYTGMTHDYLLDHNSAYINARKSNEPKVFYDYYISKMGEKGFGQRILNMLNTKASQGDAYAAKVLGIIKGAQREFVETHPVLLNSYKSMISRSDDLGAIREEIIKHKDLTPEEKNELLIDISNAVIEKNKNLVDKNKKANEKIGELQSRVDELEASAN